MSRKKKRIVNNDNLIKKNTHLRDTPIAKQIVVYLCALPKFVHSTLRFGESLQRKAHEPYSQMATIKNSFVSIKISQTNLVLELLIQKNITLKRG